MPSLVQEDSSPVEGVVEVLTLTRVPEDQHRQVQLQDNTHREVQGEGSPPVLTQETNIPVDHALQNIQAVVGVRVASQLEGRFSLEASVTS